MEIELFEYRGKCSQFSEFLVCVVPSLHFTLPKYIPDFPGKFLESCQIGIGIGWQLPSKTSFDNSR